MLTIRLRSSPCCFLWAFALISLATLSLQTDPSAEILTEFNANQRRLLAIGLTPRHMIVIFSGPYGETDSRNLYVYQMAASAFTPGASKLVTLSNGSLLKEKWPLFYNKLASKKSSHLSRMVIYHDSNGEYVLALLDAKESVLYNFKNNEAHDSPSYASKINPSDTALFSGLEPNTFYGFHVDSKPDYHHEYSAYKKFRQKTPYKVCARKISNERWRYNDLSSCNHRNQLNFSTGFANQTHFHLLGKNKLAIFKVFDGHHLSRTITMQKRQHFFRKGQNFFSKHLLRFGIGLFVIIILLLVCWAGCLCIWRRYKRSARRKSHRPGSLPSSARIHSKHRNSGERKHKKRSSNEHLQHARVKHSRTQLISGSTSRKHGSKSKMAPKRQRSEVGAKQSKLAKLPTLIMINNLHSKVAIRRPVN